jgi:signal transduction histidine kinase/ActR/RegA family two-component response regulator
MSGSSVASRLWRTYIIALVLLGALAANSHMVLRSGVAEQGHDAPLINQAGLQRALSQRLAKAALAVAAGRPAHDELRETLHELERSHAELVARTEGYPRYAELGVDARLRALRPEVDAIGAASRALLADGDPVQLDVLLAHEPVFLAQMHATVNAMELVASRKVAGVVRLGEYVLLATLLALLLEAWFVFRPVSDLVVAHIRERRDTERQLEQALQAANAATRAKSVFLANMSHELRTPLNAVCGMTDLLLDSELDEQQREWANTVQTSAEALLGQISDVLDFSKIEAGMLTLEAVDFDLDDLLDGAIRLVNPRLGDPVSLTLAVAEDAPRWLHGDPTRLRQVLLNLLSNAAKFTEQGEIRVGVRREGAMLRFDVADSGIGIGPERLDKLFRPFVQAELSTTRRFGGTGLGLAISRRIVTEMDGRIWAESTVGDGTTFSFVVLLPAASSPQPVKRRPPLHIAGQKQWVAPEWDEHRARSGMRILVAEDNLVNQRVARAILERLGHTVEVVDDGDEAVDAVQTTAYDLVFMDMQMPRMDGKAATRAIRELGIDVPIVAMTANATQEDRTACLQAGMDDFLTKPVTVDRIATQLQRWQVEEASSAAVGLP